ncbi:MAG TPA: ATP-binding protein, partial [Gemmatimonadales bacterium]|nr:ATP-binding protein [Gemmatimonadales bacterium]
LLPRGAWWLLLPALGAAAAAPFLALRRLERELRGERRARADAAEQLDRRISELFSLQELSYVLSGSLQARRIAEQVAKYARRFLEADGALVALAVESDRGARQGAPALEVIAAEGTLGHLNGRHLVEAEPCIVMNAVGRERIDSAAAPSGGTVPLLPDTPVRSAAAAPLRAHGITLGVLAVSDRARGEFTTEDLWLLSTVATHTAVVLANSRFFEMIRRGKEEWETAFDALTEGMAVVDADGRIRRANRALAALLGLTIPAVIGRHLVEALFGGSKPAADLLETAVQGGSPASLVVRSESLGRTLRLTAAPIGDGGAARSVVVLVDDVTEQLALERQLFQSERLTAVGQLVSGVAHELNNPLTSIAGLAEFLLEQGQVSDADRQHLQVIHAQAERAGRIVQNLLTFARKGAPEQAAVDLEDVVARTSLLVAHDFRMRGIELDVRTGPGPVTVRGDRYELQQVLLNLLTNAAQALGGLAEGRERRIVVATAREGDRAVLRVADTGPGVSPDDAPHLFTPFFTTKEPGEGTGLGLSISYGIVESHGGRMTYAPSPLGGAEFTCVFPLHDGTTAGGTGPSGRERPPGVPRPRAVLVVDADPAVHRIVAEALEPAGFRVDAARNGPFGLKLASEREYELVIADARAAVGPGRGFVDALLAARPEVRGRVIVTTDDVRGEQEARFRAAGLRTARKPLDPHSLARLPGLGDADQAPAGRA